MKKDLIIKTVAISSFALLFSATLGHAQLPSPNAAGLNTGLIKLFGQITAFSSKAEVQMLDKGGQQVMSAPMNFALLDNKLRLELDLSQMKNKDLPAEMLAQLKQFGMSQMLSIARPDKKATFVIYPSIRAYTEMPMSNEEAEQSNAKVEKTTLGKETVDGHPCQKNRVVLTAGKNFRQEALVWNATDLSDFPIQMRLNQPDATVVLHYKDIRLARPEAQQFEVPAGYTKHENMDKLMQAAMMKALSGK